mmetsp:Transcript_17052/g.50903  ORF Transcript_17052/g.50903 Transcript_17052/m.50903 type:complete len:344 (+) Transcript_17052:252-1283(+)|eukprot:CAMPEP_0206136180 /NCGR_PEP_ID=MMETSP1473-20131121/1414_1 /ASSEMBLY_ACC=CAM_ASM_001109 /TAXON_ID=1461547 /ORGANISM="Stichococcus sp, Strain RCC1054" /LENGTH=343 /DNA_ID=CAMNT_0053528519 /DNA_START=165 /DNA_END=1196 /DNA_ORIENTATION=-
MNPAAGRDRRKRAVANLPWLAACLAFFMVGRLFPWRPKVIHAPAFQMPPVKADAVRLLDLENSNRRQINAFVGVQTGFTAPNPPRKYNYDLRREQLRQTWFPGTPGALAKLESKHGIVARFVVGHSPDAGQETRMAAEEEAHHDFMRLNIMESYLDLARKSLAFFTAVATQFDAQYVIKVDDDVYLRMDRVPAVVKQWREEGADYVGCMKTGAIQTNSRMRWYEPQHVLLGGKSYFAHTWGSIYVLSGAAATLLNALPPTRLRYLSNEDVTVGSWMLAMNVSHFDDRRMCEPACGATSVAVYDFPKCAGLCNSVDSLSWLWKQKPCRAGPLEPPLRPQSWRFP